MTRIRAGTPVDVGGLRIIPIERVHISGSARRSGLVAMALIEPVAVLLKSGATPRALDLEGREISLDEFLPYVEGSLNGVE